MSTRKAVPEKHCGTCGTALARKRNSAGRLEDFGSFKRRRFCSLSCANTRETVGKHGLSWRGRKHLATSCDLCSGTNLLAAHHCDENRENNSAENIQTLCVSCHAWWHHEAQRRGVIPSGRAS